MISSLSNRQNINTFKVNKKDNPVSFSGNTAKSFSNSGCFNNENSKVIGFISKIIGKIGENGFKKFDFNKGQLSIASAALITFGIVLGARVYQARGKDEKREVVTRDFSAIATILFALPVLKKAFASISKYKTGFAMAYNPHNENNDRNFLQKCWDHLRPKKGYSVFSYDDLEKLYSGNKFMEKIQKIAEYGGNLSKILKKLAPENIELQRILDNKGKNKSLKDINLKIIETLKTNEKFRTSLETLFKEKENNLVKYVTNLKTVPEITGVALICSVLGFGLPWLNIWYTRGLYKNQKNNAETNSVKQTKSVETPFQSSSNQQLSPLAQQLLKSMTIPNQNSQVK